MTDSDNLPTLYTYFRSSCTWRVRIALEVAKIKVKQVPVHLVRLGGEQNKESYGEQNPMKQVPSLTVNGLRISQSMAIMEYINEICPEAKLLPSEPEQRAKVRMVCEIINSGIQPLQNLAVMLKLSDNQEERSAWSNFWITKGFRALEKVLEETSGRCCVGDSITMADCFLVPQVYNAKRFNVDLSEFPRIVEVEAYLSSLPDFIAAHPTNQPDCPPEMRTA